MTVMPLVRKVLRLSMLSGVVFGLWKTLQSRRSGEDTWDPDSWVNNDSPVVRRPVPVEAAAPAAVVTPETAPAKAPASRPPKPSAGTGPGRKGSGGTKDDPPPGERLWVPANDGLCPSSHPVKAKMSSKIFHVPGGGNYDRTKADRCYPDEASAEADGLRPPIR